MRIKGSKPQLEVLPAGSLCSQEGAGAAKQQPVDGSQSEAQWSCAGAFGVTVLQSTAGASGGAALRSTAGASGDAALRSTAGASGGTALQHGSWGVQVLQPPTVQSMDPDLQQTLAACTALPAEQQCVQLRALVTTLNAEKVSVLQNWKALLIQLALPVCR